MHQTEGESLPVSKPTSNSLAVVSLGLGILSLASIFCGGLLIGIPTSIGAIVTGVIARNQIKQSEGTQTGSGLAIAGIVLGILGVVAVAVPILIITVLALFGPAIGDIFDNILQGILTPPP